DQLAHLKVIQLVIVVTAAAATTVRTPTWAQIVIACQLIEVGTNGLPLTPRTSSQSIVYKESVNLSTAIQKRLGIGGTRQTRRKATIELISRVLEIEDHALDVVHAIVVSIGSVLYCAL